MPARNTREEPSRGITRSTSNSHELMNRRPGLVYASIEWTGEQMGFSSHNALESPQLYALPTSYEPTSWSMVGLTYHLRTRFDE